MSEENKKNLLKKKAFILALIYMFFSMTAHINASIERSRNYSYSISQDDSKKGDEPYARYNNFNIYIGSERYLSSFLKNPNNVCVLDGRYAKNPYMKIFDSHRIKSTQDMFNILGVLLQYEKENPSEWRRSIQGLQIEWIAHNISYECGILPKNTESVDLDNKDAVLYEDEVIRFIFGK